MNLHNPAFHLLAVLGNSPGVLTETLWALAQEKKPIIPQRVIILTTTQAMVRIEEELLQSVDGQPSRWQEFREAILKGKKIKNPKNFLILDCRLIQKSCGKRGKQIPLEDIRSADDNHDVADFILDQVRSLVSDQASRLIISLAGGRKTMGILLYGSISLLGRAEDRLTHVLVNSPFDSELNPSFLYPAQKERWLIDRSGKQWDARKGKIQLANLPFVPLAEAFQKHYGQVPRTFTALAQKMSQIVQEREPLRSVPVEFFRDRPEVRIKGKTYKFSVRPYLIFLFLANCKKRNVSYVKQSACLTDLELFQSKLRKEASQSHLSDWRSRLNFKMDEGQLRKNLLDLRNQIKKQGDEARWVLEILPLKRDFSLQIDKKFIIIIDDLFVK